MEGATMGWMDRRNSPGRIPVLIWAALLLARLLPAAEPEEPGAAYAATPGADSAPLPAASAGPGAGLSAGRARKVLILGLDGVRPDALARARTPHLDSLIEGGLFTDSAVTDVLARSGPGWTSVFTGTWSGRHGVRSNAFEGWRSAAYPTFFSRLRESRPGLSLGAVVAWAPIGTHLVGTDGFWMAPGGDKEVAEEAARLVRRGLPDLLFVHFDDADHAGHRFGFSPRMPFYLWAIERIDRRVGTLLAAVRERQALGEDWLVLSTTDHGGSFRHHGEDIPSHRTVFLLANGPGVDPARGHRGGGVVDLAPTVFAWLGLPVRGDWGWQGRPLGLDPAPDAGESGLAGRTTDRQQP